MNAIIIYHSEHHNNTKKIAEVISRNLQSTIEKAENIYGKKLTDYSLIGFGSGVYNGKFHDNLYKIIKNLSVQNGKKAFIFSTAGSKTYSARANNYFKKELEKKNFKIVGEFSCLGFDTALSPEGINKGRPSKQDLNDAKIFALKLNKNQY